jgi:hypothetical protein
MKEFALGESKRATSNFRKLIDGGVIRIFGERDVILPASRRHNRDGVLRNQASRKSRYLIPEDISMVMQALM